MPRLEQLLAKRSGLKRKQAHGAIRRGRVLVDGQPTRDPKQKVPEAAVLRLDDQDLPPPPRLAVFYKPVGVQCTVGDPWGRTSLSEAAAELLAWGLHPVGRLDADTEGLLPFSSDGQLTQRLLHPKHGVEKVYVAEVEGAPDAALTEALAAGVRTAAGVHVAEVRAIEASAITLAVTEGKHRMVRRMLANAGFPVVSLRRVAFGEMRLEGLEPGEWRVVEGADV